MDENMKGFKLITDSEEMEDKRGTVTIWCDDGIEAEKVKGFLLSPLCRQAFRKWEQQK